MAAAQSLPVGPTALFLVLAAGLCTVELTVLARPEFLARPELLATAATLDLVLGLPALGYLCLVRTDRVGPWAVVPLFLVGVGLARWWVPGPRQGLLNSLEWALVALELGLLTYLALRIRRIRRAYLADLGESLYPLDAAREAVRRTLGSRLAAEVIVSELAVLYYALAGWWKEPGGASARGRAFPCHRRNGYPALLGALLLVTGVEVVAVHLLLALWIPWVAWAATGLGIYGAVWLVGDFQCMRLHPALASESALHLRVGLRWRATVAWERIRSLRPPSWTPPGAHLRFTPFGAPDFWLELDEPVTVHGLFGIRRSVRALGVGAEEPGELEAAIRHRTGKDLDSGA